MIRINRLRLFTRSYSKPAVTDPKLIEKLDAEIEYEKQNSESYEASPVLEKFLKSNTFKIKDVPGECEVTFTKELKNEKITVIFSVEPEETFDENFDEENPESTAPVSTLVTISKHSGALAFQGTAVDGRFSVAQITHFHDPELAIRDTAEDNYARRGVYAGPDFECLDESLSSAFDDYLSARGIDDNLAEVIPEYVRYKEQKEYASWLENIKKFVK